MITSAFELIYANELSWFRIQIEAMYRSGDSEKVAFMVPSIYKTHPDMMISSVIDAYEMIIYQEDYMNEYYTSFVIMPSI